MVHCNECTEAAPNVLQNAKTFEPRSRPMAQQDNVPAMLLSHTGAAQLIYVKLKNKAIYQELTELGKVGRFGV